jgi:hypothetical protein
MGAQLRVVKKAPDFGVKRDYKISCSVFFFFFFSLGVPCILPVYFGLRPFAPFLIYFTYQKKVAQFSPLLYPLSFSLNPDCWIDIFYLPRSF